MGSDREVQGEENLFLLKIVTTDRVREIFDVVRAEMERKMGRRLSRGEALKILLRHYESRSVDFY
jgi:hypothetical protein